MRQPLISAEERAELQRRSDATMEKFKHTLTTKEWRTLVLGLESSMRQAGKHGFIDLGEHFCRGVIAYEQFVEKKRKEKNEPRA